jgi:hypothetical protein
MAVSRETAIRRLKASMIGVHVQRSRKLHTRLSGVRLCSDKIALRADAFSVPSCERTARAIVA